MIHNMFQVWINPTLQILDYKKVSFHEGCESMRGFSAEVARFYRVSLTGKVLYSNLTLLLIIEVFLALY